VAFLVVMGLLKGQSGRQIEELVKAVSLRIFGMGSQMGDAEGLMGLRIQETLHLVVAGYKIWPLASIISFTCVPVEKRVVWAGVVGLGWNVYMSLVAAKV